MQRSSLDQQARQAKTSGYPDQFTTVSDPLQILIPKQQVLAAMLMQGEERTLEEVSYAVALCADALATAAEAG